MKSVFLDTVGLLALWSESDQWHEAARVAYEKMKDEATVLVTTSYVLLECGNAAARRPFRSSVYRLREQLQANGSLVEPTAEDCELAWQAYMRNDAGNAGIVDQVSIIVMQRMGISQVFTNDQHFRNAGFVTLF